MWSLEKLSSSPRLKLILAKIRLLRIAGHVFKILSHLSQIDTSSRPVWFLGEMLWSKNEWLRAVERNNLYQESSGNNSEDPEFDRDLRSASRCAVLVSLYQSDKFLQGFIENIKNQSAFKRSDIIIASVQPSDFVRKVLNESFKDDQNVAVHEFSERLGIYDAWNFGISMTDAPYITNMNVDDLRSVESLDIQMSALDKSGADVAYQDVFYTYEYGLSWEAIKGIGLRSNLPDPSIRALVSGINFPHNAPMWRRSLHEKVGLFDANFKSAGDHDFWIRVALANGSFHKIPQMHVSYYINPEGMSTKMDSPGQREGLKILEKYRDAI